MWGLWKENIPISRLIESGYVLCWSAKWLGDEQIYFDSVHASGTTAMLYFIHDLLGEADAVVHYNGSSFDIPTLNKEFILHGFTPPAPYKQIDLLKVVRDRFRFPSNKLDYIAQALGVGKKQDHRGMELWLKCMADDAEAWKEMETYNKQDVVLLEGVYNKLVPWIKNHPNVALYSKAEGHTCPNCGSVHLQKRGFAYTHVGTYQRFQCVGCGTWSRTRRTERPQPALTQDKA